MIKEFSHRVMPEIPTPEVLVAGQKVQFARGYGKTELDKMVSDARLKCPDAARNVIMKFVRQSGKNSIVRIGNTEILIPREHLQGATSQS